MKHIIIFVKIIIFHMSKWVHQTVLEFLDFLDFLKKKFKIYEEVRYETKRLDI